MPPDTLEELIKQKQFQFAQKFGRLFDDQEPSQVFLRSALRDVAEATIDEMSDSVCSDESESVTWNEWHKGSKAWLGSPTPDSEKGAA